MSRPRATLDPFTVIADPTRRGILDLLRGGERTVSALVERFSVTQSAISQHLKHLRDAGLVATRRDGREIYYRLVADPLAVIAAWVAQYEGFWTEKLSGLGDLLRDLPDDEDG
jgi:DNA-binding transcriptional ArsR family regulator